MLTACLLCYWFDFWLLRTYLGYLLVLLLIVWVVALLRSVVLVFNLDCGQWWDV